MRVLPLPAKHTKRRRTMTLNNSAIVNKTALTWQEKLDRLLAKTTPSKRDLTQQMFLSLYPKLEEYLTQGRLLKEVLAAFNKLAEANICQRTFRDMLDKERKRHAEIGDVPCCPNCSRPLVLHAPFGSNAESSASANRGDEE